LSFFSAQILIDDRVGELSGTGGPIASPKAAPPGRSDEGLFVRRLLGGSGKS
jgi:hypothetical protein